MSDNELQAESIEVAVTQADGYVWRFKVAEAEVKLPEGQQAVIKVDDNG